MKEISPSGLVINKIRSFILSDQKELIGVDEVD